MKLTWIAPLVVMDLLLSAIGCGDGQPGITPLPAPTTILAPTPVPASDGTGISFVHTPWPFSGGLPEIYVVNSDGSNQTNLTNEPAGDWNPSWGPDGTKIGFYSKRDGNYEIYVMDADGFGQTRLTDNPHGDQDPSWSSSLPKN